MAFSNSYAEAYMKCICGMVQSAPNTSAYIALSTTTPNPDGSNFTEPSDTYRRVQIGYYSTGSQYINKMTVTATGGVGTATSNDYIFFPEASASWGTVTHFGIFSAATGGVPIIYGELTAPVTIQANYVPMFRIGALVITIS